MRSGHCRGSGHQEETRMKRFHIHVSVNDLAKSIGFYSTLFGAEPSKIEADYAKWMLDDPRMNFAISTHRQPVGVNHLGFQVDSGEELRGLHTQLQAADAQLVQENDQPQPKRAACRRPRRSRALISQAAVRDERIAAARHSPRAGGRPAGGVIAT